MPYDDFQTILVTGGSGLLGSMLTEHLQGRYYVVSTYNTDPISFPNAKTVQLDLESHDDIYDLVQQYEPDSVFHCAAMTAVDACETNPEKARAINVAGTRELAMAAASEDARFTYVSTDAVYGGQGQFHEETDDTDPINVYTETKLAGEVAIERVHPEPLVVRTAFHGLSPGDKRSLSEWIYYTVSDGESVGLFTDAFFTPIYASDLAALLARATREGATGTYNMASTDRVSKYEFGLELASVFDLPTGLIERDKQAEHGFTAPRPVDNSLSVEKATERLGYTFPSVEDGLKRMRDDLESSSR